MATPQNPAQRRLNRAVRESNAVRSGSVQRLRTAGLGRNRQEGALYTQNRGARGRFDGTGYTARTTRVGNKNPLFYYEGGETRKVTTGEGRVIEPGGRRANSLGERAVNTSIRTAAMQGARRNTAMRRRNGYSLR